MNAPPNTSRQRRGDSEHGYTLIELLVAITISIFLVGGLLVMVQSTRNAFGNQNALAQLQDNERLVMTFMAEIIESAGYYPDPVHNSNAAALPIVGIWGKGGQGVFGTRNAAAPGDTVTIRYAAAQADNIFNCMGTQNTAALPYDVFSNKFWVNAAVPSNPVLTCTVSSSTGAFATQDIPLVNGVTNLQILYGVKRSALDTGSCTDTYVPANLMNNPNDWASVCSVKITVTFINPIAGSTSTLSIQRVIAVMNNAGVNS